MLCHYDIYIILCLTRYFLDKTATWILTGIVFALIVGGISLCLCACCIYKTCWGKNNYEPFNDH